jgi:hypothetical protein
MGRQGNKYEQTVAFVLIAFEREPTGQLKQLEQVYLQEDFELPISKKRYKATLKNVEVYIQEYRELHPSVKSIRLDRISHIKVYDCETTSPP